MKKYKSFLFQAAAIFAFSFLFAGAVFSQADLSGVTYPVQELGSCEDQSSCAAYCDDPEHVEACLAFAQKNNLMSEREVRKARKFVETGSGPGGCGDSESCKIYCDSSEHIDECVAYAEKNNLMTAEELAEAKKVQAAKARGVKMLPCGGKSTCDEYCSSSEHMEECIAFAQEAGLMNEQEYADSQRMLQAVRSGAKPPACKGKAACDEYCQEDSHFDECLDFSIAAGMMDPKEAEMAKKTRGKGPGGCKSKETCDAFCQTEENFIICAQFALDNGMMNPEEFEMSKKTRGKGPGDCKNKEECEAFCNDPANKETCFNFAKDNGLMSEEDMSRMAEDQGRFKEAFEKMPPEIYDCVEGKIGAEAAAKFKEMRGLPDEATAEAMRSCNEEIRPEHDGARIQSEIPCTSPEECEAFCAANPDKCPGYQPPQRPDPNESKIKTGPGGCSSPEECEAYCSAHREECGAPSGPTEIYQGPACTEGDCSKVPPQDGGPGPGPIDDGGGYRPPEYQQPPAQEPRQEPGYEIPQYQPDQPQFQPPINEPAPVQEPVFQAPPPEAAPASPPVMEQAPPPAPQEPISIKDRIFGSILSIFKKVF